MSQGLAIIGNCSYSALLKEGSVEWMCWPRPDSSFIFGPLLDRDQGGAFTVEGVDATDVEQVYVENTNVLRTIFRGERGSFELIDFAPRFQLYDRFFKPSMLIRILRPLSGEPRARLRCRPTYEYGLDEVGRWRASNHIEFTGLSCSSTTDTSYSRGASRSRRDSRRPRSASSSGRSTTGDAG
jgi:GH15 family glucan-1,4-alpha-glucosidase